MRQLKQVCCILMDPLIYRRLIALGLFIEAGEVLLLHQMTGPEPDCWDLPGGGVELGESLLQGLQREIREETGIEIFQVEGLVTIAERFYPKEQGQQHNINIIYRCSLPTRPERLVSQDPHEVGPKGIQWLPIRSLEKHRCSSRSWEALQVTGWI